jgi:hypothetical protein
VVRQAQFLVALAQGEGYELCYLIPLQGFGSSVQLRLKTGDCFHHLADCFPISLVLLSAAEGWLAHQHVFFLVSSRLSGPSRLSLVHREAGTQASLSPPFPPSLFLSSSDTSISSYQIRLNFSRICCARTATCVHRTISISHRPVMALDLFHNIKPEGNSRCPLGAYTTRFRFCLAWEDYVLQ